MKFFKRRAGKMQDCLIPEMGMSREIRNNQRNRGGLADKKNAGYSARRNAKRKNSPDAKKAKRKDNKKQKICFWSKRKKRTEKIKGKNGKNNSKKKGRGKALKKRLWGRDNAWAVEVSHKKHKKPPDKKEGKRKEVVR